jgi:hypothetical protein
MAGVRARGHIVPGIRGGIGTFLLCISVMWTAPLVWAEPAAGDPNARVNAIEKQLQTLSNELAELKAHETASAPGEKAPSPVPDWVQRTRISGDFRYRHEHTDDETQSARRDRDRIQLHLGLSAAVNEDLDVIARLCSGNNAAPVSREEAGSATSGNQDLDDAFSRKNIWIDLACLDYHPMSVPGLDVLAGKLKNPFFTPGRSDLLLDRDVTPEGGALTYRTRRGEAVTLFGSAGGFWVEERSTTAETSLWALQGGVTVRIPEAGETTATAGMGYYGYGHIRGRPAIGLTGSFYGNRSVGGTYASGFDIWQGFTEIGFPVFTVPCTLFCDILKNASAGTSEDHGYYVGFTVGKCDKPGSWEFMYNYRDLEADAIPGVFAEATFAGGGTNVRGHVLSAGYQLLKNLQFVASYMSAERTNTSSTVTTDHDTVLLDLVARF